MNFWRSKFFDVKQLTDGIVKRGRKKGRQREIDSERKQDGGQTMQTLLGLSIKIKALAIKLSFSTFKTLSGEAKR